MLDRITVHGARQHNLKNIDVEIPRNSLTVITGLSGSGKSSLAFDTIYAEGQRRYVETLSTYARQFLDQMERPDVDSIDGLSPAISIEQKTTSRSPRSTVGTITEIYDYLRVLYSSIGVPHCPVCGNEISRQTTEQILQHVVALKPEDRIMVMAPVVRGRKGEYKKDLEKLARQGFVRARIDGVLRSLDEEIVLDKRRNHTIEVVVDRLLVKPGIEKRLEASIETATKLAGGLVLIVVVNGEERLYSQKLACTECGTSIPQLEPRSFSFNSPYGACEDCHGLGSMWIVRPGQGDRGPFQAAARRGAGAGGRLLVHAAATAGAGAQGPHQPEEALRRASGEGADGAAGGSQRAAGDPRNPAAELRIEHRGVPRMADGVHVAGRVPGLSRASGCKAVQPGGAGEEFFDRRVHGPAGGACADDGAELGIRRARDADCGAGGGGDPPPAGVPLRGGAGLPQPGTLGRHTLGRRGAAHPAGHADRLEAARRSVRAGRAFDRAASARQRAAAGDADAPAGHGQHGAGGGARRRDHRARRLRDRPGAGRRPAGRRTGGGRGPGGDRRAIRIRSPDSTCRERRRSRCRHRGARRARRSW